MFPLFVFETLALTDKAQLEARKGLGTKLSLKAAAKAKRLNLVMLKGRQSYRLSRALPPTPPPEYGYDDSTYTAPLTDNRRPRRARPQGERDSAEPHRFADGTRMPDGTRMSDSLYCFEDGTRMPDSLILALQNAEQPTAQERLQVQLQQGIDRIQEAMRWLQAGQLVHLCVYLVEVAIFLFIGITASGALSHGTMVANAFTAYDCEADVLSTLAVDLTAVQSCPDPKYDYDKPEPQKVQILQTGDSVPVIARQCLVTYSKEVTACGFNHLTYTSENIAFSRSFKVSEEDCRHLHITHELKVMGVTRRIPNVNQTKSISQHWTHGKVVNGKCETEDFLSEGRMFYGSYEQMSLTVIIRKIVGSFDRSDAMIKFDNGLYEPHKAGHVYDLHEGTVVWDKRDPECEKGVIEVYKGMAQIHKFAGNHGAHHWNLAADKSVIMLEDTDSAQYAGLVMKQPVEICGQTCHRTQIKDLVVCLLREHDFGLTDTMGIFDPTNTDLKAQMSYLHVDMGLKLTRSFNTLTLQQCELERKILTNDIQSLSGAHNRHGLMEHFPKGANVVVNGAVAYVQLCQPVEVTRIDYANCTEEIPIVHNGTIKFADPHTFILQPHASIVPCSQFMAPAWKISGQWFCSYPQVRACQQPKQLNITNYNFLDSFMSIGVSSGVFNQAAFDKHKEYLRTYQSRPAVNVDVTNTAVQGAEEEHPSYLGPTVSIDDITYDNLVWRLAAQISPMYYFLGSAWPVVCGCFIAVSITKILAGTIWRMLTIYQLRGMGIWVLYAVWATAFAIFKTPLEVAHTAYNHMVSPVRIDSYLQPHGQVQRAVDHELRQHHHGNGPTAPPAPPPPAPPAPTPPGSPGPIPLHNGQPMREMRDIYHPTQPAANPDAPITVQVTLPPNTGPL